MPRSMVRMPGSSWSVVARPSGVISMKDAAPVGGVGDAADPAAAFEQVEGGGHGGGGDQDPVADLRGGERGAGPVDDGQRCRGGLRDAEGRGDVPVELAQQGLAGAAQGRVGLGAGGVAAGVLVGEIGVYLDDAKRGRGGAAAPPRPHPPAWFRHP